MSEGLPDLVSHVRLDTTGVSSGVAKTKAELGGLSGATSGLEKDFKGLLSSILGLGPGTSALSGHFSTLSGAADKLKGGFSSVSGEGNTLKSILPAVGVGVAGLGVAVAGFAVAAVGKFIAVAGEVNKLKTTLGSTAEDASRVRNVAIGLGVDVDTMGKAFFKLGPILEKNQGDLAGVHVEIAKNANGTSDLIGTIDNMRKAYQSIQDPIQKAQFLQEAFKKTGLDLRPILAANAEQFNKLANTGPIIHQADIDKAKELAIAQRELKQKLDDVEVSFVQKAIPAYEKADHAAFQFFKTLQLGAQRITGIGDTSKTVDQISHAFDKGKGSAAAYAEKLEETRKAAEDAAKALDKLVTAQEAAFDKDLSLEHAQASLTKAIRDNSQAHKDAEAAVREYGRASDEADQAINRAIESDSSLKDATIAAAKATRDKAVADQEAAGATVSATDKVELLVSALRDQASHLAPGSELRTNLEDYANKLESGIPAEKNTHVTIDTSEAESNVARLKAHIDSLGTSVTRAPVQDTGGDNSGGSYSDSNSGGSQTPSGGGGGGGGGSDNTNYGDSATGNILGPKGIIPLAAGGTRTAGFVTNGPRFLVGEGDPAYPEFVIATDPKFRDRNRALASRVNRVLGLAAGGAIKDQSEYDSWQASQPNGTPYSEFESNSLGDPHRAKEGWVEDFTGRWVPEGTPMSPTPMPSMSMAPSRSPALSLSSPSTSLALNSSAMATQFAAAVAAAIDTTGLADHIAAAVAAAIAASPIRAFVSANDLLAGAYAAGRNRR